jgi:hypothetical protein
VIAGLKEAKNLAGKVLHLIQDPFADGEFVKNLACLSRQLNASANRRFKFHKRGQLFICTYNETLSVAAMCVNNEDSFAGHDPQLRQSPNSIRLRL